MPISGKEEPEKSKERSRYSNGLCGIVESL